MSKHRVKRKMEAKKGSRWPLAAALTGILLIVGAVLLTATPGQENYSPKVNGAPAIEVEQQVFDYGAVKLGGVITTEVKVTNIGDEPLRFTARPYVELVEGC